MNITQPIDEQARLQPQAPSMVYEAVEFTYGQLVEAIARTAWQLQLRGICSGDLVAVTMPSRPPHLIVLLALARLGAVSVGLSPVMPPVQQRALIARLGVRHLVCSPGMPANFAEGTGLPAIEVHPAWMQRPAQGSTQLAPGGSRVWRVALSSGTTGLPKALAWTHERSLRLGALTAGLMPIHPSTRSIACIDLATNYSLHQALRHLAHGACVVFPPAAGPEYYVDAIHRHRVDVASTTPAIVLRMLDALRATHGAVAPSRPLCPGLESLIIGGSSLAPSAQAAIRQWITPNLGILYGSSEAGPLAWATPDMLRDDPSITGRCVPWVQARALDAAGAPLPPGEHGRLAFRSDVFCTAYEGDPQASAATFCDGWYLTGDSGSVDADGVVRLSGRDDDLINLDGVKIQPERIEAVLRACPGIDDAAVYAVAVQGGARSELQASVVSRWPVDAAALLRACHAALGPLQCPARVVRVDALPRNENGKLVRTFFSQVANA